MPGPPTLYCALADVLALLSLDAQARLATDPESYLAIGVGDGTTGTFSPPFLGATTINVTVNGSPASAESDPAGPPDRGYRGGRG